MTGVVIAAAAGFIGGFLVGGLVIGNRTRKYYESQIQEYENYLNKARETIEKFQESITNLSEEIEKLKRERLQLLVNWINSEKETINILYMNLMQSGEFKDLNQLITLKFRRKFLDEIISKIENREEISQEELDLINGLKSPDPATRSISEANLLNRYNEEEVLIEFYNAIRDKMILIQREIKKLEDQKIEKENEIESLKTKEEVEGLSDKEKEKLEDILKELEYIEKDLERYENIYNQSRNFIALAAATVYYKEEEYVKSAINILKKAFKGQYLTKEDKETLNLIAQVYLPKVKDKIKKNIEIKGENIMLL